VEAVPEPARGQDREGEDDDEGDGSEHAERPKRSVTAGDRPEVDGCERNEDERIELRGRRDAE